MVAKKNIANMPAIASTITPLAVASERILKMSSRTSACLWTRSTSTKAISSTTPRAPKPSVVAEPQPSCSALTIA